MRLNEQRDRFEDCHEAESSNNMLPQRLFAPQLVIIAKCHDQYINNTNQHDWHPPWFVDITIPFRALKLVLNSLKESPVPRRYDNGSGREKLASRRLTACFSDHGRG